MVIFADVVETPGIIFKAKKGTKKLDTGRQSELVEEMQHLREEMQNTLEEMQTSQEELKSTNEELQSTNEELQSTNEELDNFKRRNAKPERGTSNCEC